MTSPRILICMVAVTVCLLPGAALGTSVSRAKVALPPTGPLTMTCVVDAASINRLPLAALVGILAAENGRPGEALLNDNGTWDMGPYQVRCVGL